MAVGSIELALPDVFKDVGLHTNIALEHIKILQLDKWGNMSHCEA